LTGEGGREVMLSRSVHGVCQTRRVNRRTCPNTLRDGHLALLAVRARGGTEGRRLQRVLQTLLQDRGAVRELRWREAMAQPRRSEKFNDQ